jgi:hypothetical protein
MTQLIRVYLIPAGYISLVLNSGREMVQHFLLVFNALKYIVYLSVHWLPKPNHKMKKLLFITIALTISMLSTSAQSFKEDPNFVKQAPNAKGYMLDTVSASTLTIQQLYSNALSFLSNNFKDSRSVVESKDLELGEISFKGNMRAIMSINDTSRKGKITTHQEPVILFFKSKIYLKNNKFKIVINSLERTLSAILSLDIKLPVDVYNVGLQSNEDKTTSNMALSLIKELSVYLNKKPENDF